MDYKVQLNVKRQHDDNNDPSRGEVDKESSSVGGEQAPFFYHSNITISYYCSSYRCPKNGKEPREHPDNDLVILNQSRLILMAGQNEVCADSYY